MTADAALFALVVWSAVRPGPAAGGDELMARTTAAQAAGSRG
jgi:hypothetical protein